MRTIICLCIPLIIIIGSILLSIAIIKGKIEVRYNICGKIIYWCTPALFYYLLYQFSEIFLHFEDSMGREALGIIVYVFFSIITPLFLYVGMLCFEFSKNVNKHRIIWITPICIVFLYYFIFLLFKNHKEFNPSDLIGMKFVSFLIYINGMIIGPTIVVMLTRLKIKK